MSRRISTVNLDPETPNLKEIRQIVSEIKHTDGKKDTSSYKHYALILLQKKKTCNVALTAWTPAGGGDHARGNK
jgi:hypothetical protein